MLFFFSGLHHCFHVGVHPKAGDNVAQLFHGHLRCGEISGLYYKHIMIVIDAASVVSK
jgi:hypothetical protein